MVHWLKDPSNLRHVTDLREALAQDEGGVVAFIGAGMSYGSSRKGMRGSYELRSRWRDDAVSDDGRPFPTWPKLIERMQTRLLELPDMQAHVSEIKEFFAQHDPLDCAELFEECMGAANSYQFLRDQFDDPHLIATPSHHNLWRLPIKDLYTTNYDKILEDISERTFVVSATPQEFNNNRNRPHDRHIIKLHGSIDNAESIVLTRSQYATSRKDRVEMYAYLGQAMRAKKFLYLGYSLSDPDFNQLYDEMRLALGRNVPPGYVVQGKSNSIRDKYLRGLHLNSINLNSWNHMPQLLDAINPETDFDALIAQTP
jgi:hypothetical protein